MLIDVGQYVSQSGFAKLAGVSRQAITQAVKEGRLESCKLGIDPEHPTNRHYLATSRANAHRNTDRGSQQKRKSAPKSVRGKKVDITALTGGLIGTELDDYLSALSKPSTDRLKVVEQIKALRLKTDERRLTHVPRETVRRVFSRIYMVDTNEFRTLPDKLASEVASICGIDDDEKVFEIKEIIELNVFKVLNHVKRLINDFLEEIRDEPLP